MRAHLLRGGAGVLFLLPTVLAFFAGGFFDRPRIWAGLVAWALVVLAACVAPRPLPTSTPGRLALAGMGVFFIWTTISIAWAPLGEGAQDDAQRALLYLGFLTAAVPLLRARELRPLFEPALVAGALVVSCYGLSERFFPTLIHLNASRSALGRIEQPISYWNAYGLAAALGFVLAVRIAGDPHRVHGLRSAGAAACVPLGLGVYLSFSRGALGAVAVGLVLLLALAPDGRAQLRAIVVLLGCEVALALVASAFLSVRSLSDRNAAEGAAVLALVVLLSVAAALLAPRRGRRRVAAPRLPWSRARVVMSTALVALTVGALLYVALEGTPRSISPNYTRTSDAARLRSIESNRYRYWRAAVDSFVHHPLRGIGSGGFKRVWIARRDRTDAANDAHSLYVETAAELGIVGLGALAMLMAGAVLAVVRLYRREPALATGVAGALAAWAFHAGIDWDWEMPAVSLTALLLVAAAVAWSEADGEAGSPGAAEREREARVPAGASI